MIFCIPLFRSKLSVPGILYINNIKTYFSILALFIFRIFPIERGDNMLNSHTTLGLKPGIFFGRTNTSNYYTSGWFASMIYFNDMTIFDFIHRST